jgi:hypothetical protein
MRRTSPTLGRLRERLRYPAAWLAWEVGAALMRIGRGLILLGARLDGAADRLIFPAVHTPHRLIAPPAVGLGAPIESRAHSPTFHLLARDDHDAVEFLVAPVPGRRR